MKPPPRRFVGAGPSFDTTLIAAVDSTNHSFPRLSQRAERRMALWTRSEFERLSVALLQIEMPYLSRFGY
jgi:hypothetical protein